MKNLETITWESLEKEYNIKFRLKNGEFRPVNEWLDDLYLRMTYDEAKAEIHAFFTEMEKKQQEQAAAMAASQGGMY